MQTVTAQVAAARLNAGTGVVIDIRGADEFAQAHIPGAIHLEAERIDADAARKLAALKPIFCCASGRRTAMLMRRLEGAAGTEALAIEGGLASWQAAGYPVNRAAGQSSVPNIQRQVMIAVGIMLVIISAIAYLAWPPLVIAAGAVGLGLLFAGVTGNCMLAAVLMRMPWNRPGRSAGGSVLTV